MKDVQCYEIFRGIALKNHAFSFSFSIGTCTTSNDVLVKSKFVLNVMLEPKVDLYAVAIPLPRDRDCRGNDLTSNPLGANLAVFAWSP